jgi:hypothetical protein
MSLDTGRASSAPQQPRQLSGGTTDPQLSAVEGLYLTPNPTRDLSTTHCVRCAKQCKPTECHQTLRGMVAVAHCRRCLPEMGMQLQSAPVMSMIVRAAQKTAAH